MRRFAEAAVSRLNRPPIQVTDGAPNTTRFYRIRTRKYLDSYELISSE